MTVRLLALGGLGEFGANCLAIETAADLLVIDAGLLFPEDTPLGLEALIPDFAWIAERRDKLRGIVLTHGHEDHVGALAYLLAAAPAPVWGGQLTLALVRRRLRERGLDPTLGELVDGRPLELGGLRVTPIAVAHSIPDAFALAVDTPAGRIVHSGDWKLESRGELDRLTEQAGTDVALLLADSTNALRAGRTPPESTTRSALERGFDGAPGRVLLTTFSSQVDRLAAFAATCQHRQRGLALVGRSLRETFAMTRALGYLTIPPDLMLPAPSGTDPVPPGAAVAITGCQGEATSALVRAARGELPALRLAAGDRLLYSARPIPGREKAIGRAFDALVRCGCEVVDDPDLHVSGHGARDDLADLLGALRPRAFLPIHGTLRLLDAHRRLAAARLPDVDAVVVENGFTIDMERGRRLVVAAESIPMIRRVVLSSDGREALAPILRMRARLAAGGVVAIALPTENGRLGHPPAVTALGLGDDDALAAEIRERLVERLALGDLAAADFATEARRIARRAAGKAVQLVVQPVEMG